MKSLQTIQKTFRVFQILTKVAMILAFVGAGLVFLGLICGIAISGIGTVIFGGMETLYDLTASASFYEMIGTLLVEFILTLTDAILMLHAFRYFSAEQADGTPFTESGAVQIKRLGILLIVMPAVATILAGVIYGIFGLTQIDAADLGNGTSAVMGIMLILGSLIIRYGAEIEGNHEAIMIESRHY